MCNWKYILLLLSGNSNQNKLVGVKSSIFLLIFSFFLSIIQRRILNSLTIIIDMSISSWLYFEYLLLGNKLFKNCYVLLIYYFFIIMNLDFLLLIWFLWNLFCLTLIWRFWLVLALYIILYPFAFICSLYLEHVSYY